MVFLNCKEAFRGAILNRVFQNYLRIPGMFYFFMPEFGIYVNFCVLEGVLKLMKVTSDQLKV